MSHILLVEDDKAVRDMTATVLSRAGYTVIAAAGPEEALASFAVARPDLILLDMMIPRLADGFDLLTRFRHLSGESRIPIQIVSGLGDEILCAMDERGVVGIVQKPFRVADLLRQVSELVGDAQKRPQVLASLTAN